MSAENLNFVLEVWK